MKIANYAKAIVPVIVGVVLFALSHIGVTPDMSVKEVLTTLITAGLVYFVPNKA